MKKILIIDDSATSRMLFKAHLDDQAYALSQHFEVHEAHNEKEAFEQATRINPDIIILDYNMPEINGTDLAKNFIDSGIKSDYILCTANTQQSVINATETLGFKAIIEKPVTAEKLSVLLGEYI